MTKRMSLKKLAAHLSLTEGTVSRALNNYPDISPKTRDRVQKAAIELGYNANPVARRLATGVAEAVAYIMPKNHGLMSEPFVSQLLSGISESLAQRGWDLLVTQSPSGEDDEKMIRELVTSGRVSGIVISRPYRNDPRIRMLKDSKFPFIVHGRSGDSDDYAWYDVDSKAAFIEGVDHLVALGHKRIGLIGGPTYYNFAQSRLEGYREALVTNGLKYDDRLVQITEMTDDGGARAAGDLLDGELPPTALLCMTDTLALGVLSAIRARGLKPGKHISVVGYDGIRFGQHTNPPLTTMAQPQAHSGRQLGEMLLAIIDGGNPKDYQILRRAEFVRRKSDGPVWGAGDNPKGVGKKDVLSDIVEENP